MAFRMLYRCRNRSAIVDCADKNALRRKFSPVLCGLQFSVLPVPVAFSLTMQRCISTIAAIGRKEIAMVENDCKSMVKIGDEVRSTLRGLNIRST